ncbi:MAG: PAS domain-containing protein [Fibrobacteria bacterium]|nr:PAS domain-containing protein [Fibrobacteria bacterium]
MTEGHDHISFDHEHLDASAPLLAEAEGEYQGLGFPLVALCASAGGLGAFEAFLKGLPTDRALGMSFIVVQHISPDRPSMLAELLRRYTNLVVQEIDEGMEILPDHLFVIPPDREISVREGRFLILPFNSPRPQRHPIDTFLRSMAWTQGEYAVAAILSGTGDDGTVGIEAIKQHGGMVLAQETDACEFPSMPQNAISTGLVDHVLPPESMGERILEFFERPQETRSARRPNVDDEPLITAIFDVLQTKVGHDFTQYKAGTLYRRVVRRMGVHQIPNLEEYSKFLEASATEASALFRELLIGVTRFFRDQDAFRALAEKVVPELFANRPANRPVRVWVPGCATGEEAYGIAMLLAEHQDATGSDAKIQVYATDIDAHAIAKARSGIYPVGISADVPPHMMEKYFTLTESGGSIRIQKRIREMLIFSEQNLTRDPPFSRMDLVSCRNLLIYMGSDLQRRLISVFHSALNPSGILFLGSSEHIGDHASFFAPIDRGAKLYRRVETGRRGIISPTGRFLPSSMRTPSLSVAHPAQGRASSLREFTERSLLSMEVRTALLLNADGDILYQHGRIGKYFEFPADAPGTTNALRMAREGLRIALTTALRKAVAENQPIRTDALRIRCDGSIVRASMKVRPVPQPDPSNPLPGTGPGIQSLFLVVIEELEDSHAHLQELEQRDFDHADVDDTRLAELLHELEVKDEHLQASREALESSNEDLTASNEELQSINEELQSANEELETSKEELQSVYEELTTVNAELQAKLVDLSNANNDMLNLLAGTGIATIFVDRALRIMRFTPEATRIVNLIQTDAGRPIAHILTNLSDYDGFVGDIQTTLERLETFSRDVQTKDGAWFALRIQPYRTQEGAVEGAVITFADVTGRKRMEADLREHESRLRAILESYPEPIYLKDRESRLLVGNQATMDVIGMPYEEVIGKSDMEFYDDPEAAQVILDNDQLVMSTGETLVREERVPGPDGERVFLSTKAPWRDAEGRIVGVVGISRDVTESHRMSSALRASEGMFRNLVETLPLAIYVSTGPELQAEYLNPRFTELFGYVLEEVPNAATWWPLAFPDEKYREEVSKEWNSRVLEALRTGVPIEPMEVEVTCKDGTVRNIQWRYYVLGGKNYGCGQDLTDIRKGEKALQESLAEKDRLLGELHRREAEARSAADELRVVMESMPAFTFVSRDPECRRMESSAMALERMRISPEIRNSPEIPHDVKPRVYKVMQDGEVLEPRDFPLRRAIREKRSILDEEIQILFPDGETLHLFGNAVPLVDDQGEVRGGVGAFIDISAQKRGEEELRRSQAELSLVLDNTAEAIAFLDLDRRLVWANRAYLQSVAGTPEAPAKLEDLKGKRCIDAWGLPRFCDDCPVEKCRTTCMIDDAEFAPGTNSDWPEHLGSWQVRAAPVRDASGAVVGTIEVARSIAEKLQMEEQVRQSEKLAAVGQLAGGVAHNFNNQLTGIMGYADLLLLKSRDQAVRPLVDGIKGAALRAAQLTGQLLAFARKGNYQKIPIDVDRIVEETTDLLKQTIDRRISVERSCGAKGVRVVGDPSQMHNALLNLGLNARDAMPEGGLLRMSTSVLEDGDDEVAPGINQGAGVLRIEVLDTGTGMPPHVQKRIFEPFFTTKPVGTGTGLGLASVHGTLASMGGVIDVRSEEERGSVFVIHLPILPTEAALHKETSLEPIRMDRPLRILLIDDEDIVLETSSAMLLQLGYKVTSFSNPVEAIEFHAKNVGEIDVVILDLVMPQMSGKEVLQAMRRKSPQVRVVVSSGYSLEETRPSFSEGVAAFLQKPFNMADLSHAVAMAIGKEAE